MFKDIAAATAGPSIDQLHDIVLPAAPGIFPLAYGWWILIALVVVISAKGTQVAINRFKFFSVKRLALKKLAHCKSCDDINQLLKQVAMHYFPASHVAPLEGKQWSNFLGKNLDETKNNELQEVINNLYRPSNANFVPVYHLIARHWLNTLTTRQIKEINHAVV